MPLIVLPAPSSVIICRHAVIKGLQYAFLQELRARGKRPQLEAEAPAAAAAAASKATGSSAEAASPDDGAVDAAALAFTANDNSITAANNEEEQQARKLNTSDLFHASFWGEDSGLVSQVQDAEKGKGQQQAKQDRIPEYRLMSVGEGDEEEEDADMDNDSSYSNNVTCVPCLLLLFGCCTQ